MIIFWQCHVTVVPIAASLNLSHSDAHSRFSPAETEHSMERTSCLLNLLMSSTATVFLLLMKIFVTFFLKTVLCSSCLFHSVTSVVSRMFFKMNKSKNYTPGFIMVLHTFGRDLKWNPHIHCLISEGGYSDDGFWRPVHHFNYTYLRNAFTQHCDEMGRRLGSSFKKIKSQCYTNHKEGFYVYAKPNKCDPETVIKIHWTLSWTASYYHIQNGLTAMMRTRKQSHFITTVMKMTNIFRKQSLH